MTQRPMDDIGSIFSFEEIANRNNPTLNFQAYRSSLKNTNSEIGKKFGAEDTVVQSKDQKHDFQKVSAALGFRNPLPSVRKNKLDMNSQRQQKSQKMMRSEIFQELGKQNLDKLLQQYVNGYSANETKKFNLFGRRRQTVVTERPAYTQLAQQTMSEQQKLYQYSISGTNKFSPRCINQNHMDQTVRKMDLKRQQKRSGKSLLQRTIHAASILFLSFSLSFASPVLAADQSIGPQFAFPKEIMTEKQHGTCSVEVQKELRFGVDVTTADIVSCYNKSLTEVPGYAFQEGKMLEHDLRYSPTRQLMFFDSVTSKKLFRAPIGRSFESFLTECKKLGYISFRDNEVMWENVRVLVNGNVVSVDGTFLGRVAPDKDGNRYAINLSAIAGKQKDNWLISLIPDPKNELTQQELLEFYQVYKVKNDIVPGPDDKEPTMTDLQELYQKEKALEKDDYLAAKVGYEVSPFPIALTGENCQVTSIKEMLQAAGDNTPIVEETTKFQNNKSSAKKPTVAPKPPKSPPVVIKSNTATAVSKDNQISADQNNDNDNSVQNDVSQGELN